MELSLLTWIIIGVVLVAIIAILLIVFGLRRNKAKQVSFEKKEEIEKPKPSSGNYQAQSGFNFTSGAATKEAAPEDTDEGQTTIGGVRINRPADSLKQPEARPAPKQTEPKQTERKETEPEKAEPKQTEPAKPVEKPQTPEPKKPEPAQTDKPADKSEPKQAEPEKKPGQDSEDKPENKADSTPVVPPVAAPPVTAPPAADKAEDKPAAEEAEVGVEKEQEQPEQPSETPEDQLNDAAVARAEEQSQQVEQATTPETIQEEQPTADPADDIAPVDGRMGKLRSRMAKSQNVIGKGVLGILSAGDLDEDAWEEIEDTLLMADLGTKTTLAVVDDLRGRIATQGVSSEAEARAMLRAALIDACKPQMDRSIKAMPYEGKPAVIMVVGVNGTGKTTTTGKLSRVLIGMGHSVTLGAADTFRAAAADQLETWGRRVGAKTVRGDEGADPASVAFDAVSKGIEDSSDVVLVDTAGRLHTSVGLMDQLGKVKRVVEKRAKVDEVLLVLDATVGQNGLTQARVFREVVDITGVVLTKLDGTAKGGIVFQVQEELGVPVKLVGLGEGEDHLAPFEVESFVDALLG
ncbi:signal recognition particle-docking protein FtsY [Corynebacterium dentalis]|uniref:signal recognition particle-docking protein FtsY n=1 Tax=Corynebacterium dentalis TaxID=2014528 RepID=UPI00289D7ED3|nr:signal recognition particle-docking protein FtsY [Corynebacterium dentalis]